jgi:hypothetical protein
LDEYNGTRNGVPRHPEKLLNTQGRDRVMLVTGAANIRQKGGVGPDPLGTQKKGAKFGSMMALCR